MQPLEDIKLVGEAFFSYYYNIYIYYFICEKKICHE